MRAALYARVSTYDQQTLPLQMLSMQQYAQLRGWTIIHQIQEVASGTKKRPLREALLIAAHKREIDVHHRLEVGSMGTLSSRSHLFL